MLALENHGTSQSKRREFCEKTNILTLKIVDAFGTCRIRDKYGVCILTSVAEALGHDVTSLSISTLFDEDGEFGQPCYSSY